MSLRLGAILVLVPFTVLTAVAIGTDGAGGFPAAITFNLTSLQIWIDLVIAMLFWCAWVMRDARNNGRSGIPWVIAALLVGAFAPLIYMIVYRRWPATPGQTSAAPATGSSRALRVVAAVVFVVFAVFTAAAIATDGSNIAAAVTRTWSNIQIWVDLVIVVVLWLVWMVQDARRAGRNPWGWVLFALVLGAFSPLLYTAVYGRWPASHPNEGRH